MEELLYEFNPWWESKKRESFIERKKYLDALKGVLNKKDIIFLTGLRRVGKTTLMKQIIYNLLGTGTSPEKICYISLDALGFKGIPISELVMKFKEIHKIPSDEKVFLFLDEVAIKKDFNQELKNLYDLGYYKIFASSSSASLLIDKKAMLTGRSRYFEIEPLDFQEFMVFNEYFPKKSEKHLVKRYFEEYMETGGMPEYVLTSDPEYINSLINNILYKDIIAKHNIREEETVLDLFRLLCERTGKQLSYNKLAKILDVGKDTVIRIIRYFIDAYLFRLVEVKGRLNEKIKGKKKIYCADVGIKNVVTGFRDKGAIYENLVFLKIKHMNPEFINKDGVEIDFWYKDHLIEAKYGLPIEGKQKEVFENFKAKNKIIASDYKFFE